MLGLVLFHDRQQEVCAVVSFVACHQGHDVLNPSMLFGALFSVSLLYKCSDYLSLFVMAWGAGCMPVSLYLLL